MFLFASIPLIWIIWRFWWESSQSHDTLLRIRTDIFLHELHISCQGHWFSGQPLLWATAVATSIHHLLTFSTVPWAGERVTDVATSPHQGRNCPPHLDIRLLSDPGVHRFTSAPAALIIHGAESRSHRRDSADLSQILSVWLCDSISSFFYIHCGLEWASSAPRMLKHPKHRAWSLLITWKGAASYCLLYFKWVTTLMSNWANTPTRHLKVNTIKWKCQLCFTRAFFQIFWGNVMLEGEDNGKVFKYVRSQFWGLGLICGVIGVCFGDWILCLETYFEEMTG